MSRNMSVLEFETRFIKLTAQLEGVGLPCSAKEKYMSYIEKVGVRNGEAIRLDRRQRQDKNGLWSERLPETWEEAHAVVIEREAVSAGSRILKEHWSYTDEQALRKSAHKVAWSKKALANMQARKVSLRVTICATKVNANSGIGFRVSVWSRSAGTC